MNLFKLPDNIRSVALNAKPSAGSLAIHITIDSPDGKMETDLAMTPHEYTKAMMDLGRLGKYSFITAQGADPYEQTVIIMTADNIWWGKMP